jgi:hypothetical protein
MSREFRFRAWDKVAFKMDEYFIVYSDGRIYQDRGFDDDIYSLKNSSVNDRYQVMQFTGIYDCKENRIFEGDIIFAYERKWKVLYSEGCFIAKSGRQIKLLRTMYCEVIGNVFQQPKLIGGS